MLGPYAKQSVEFENAVWNVASSVPHPHEQILDLPRVPSHGSGLQRTVSERTQDCSLDLTVKPRERSLARLAQGVGQPEGRRIQTLAFLRRFHRP